MTPSELKTFNMVSQNAHWLTGMSYAFFFMVIGHPHLLLYAIPFYILLTAWKEFWYDYKYETSEIRGSSLEDFIFYQIGWIGGLIVYFVTIKL